MTFWDFFFYKGRPSIFFAVELGAVTSFFVLYFIFKNLKEKTTLIPVEKVRSWVPTILLVSLIVLLALSSFFDTEFSYAAGIICMVCGIIALLWEKFVNKGSIVEGIKSLDWETTLFLAAMLLVAVSMSNNLGINPSLFLFGLLIGTSLGGNITPIGASANIVTCGLLKKEGYEVKFTHFVKIGLPFTLVAVSAAYLLIWFVWSK